MRKRPPVVALGALAVLGAAVALGAGTASAASSATVAKDGSGNYSTVQAAINAVPSGNASRFTITIKPGDYHEVVTVPSNKPYITLVGSTGNRSDVVIEYNHANDSPNGAGGTLGTSGSASVTVSAHDFIARNLSIGNTFNEAASSFANKQAVALNTQGDRETYDNVRLFGNQDTLELWSSGSSTRTRAYFRQCYIEGDVDVIFGRGTGVFDRCEIHSLSRGSSANNGFVTAAATDRSNPYGFLFSSCNLTSNAPAGTVYLGRPWHPGGDANAVGQVLYRNSTLGVHIKGAPWTDMSGFSWKDARFSEYRNSGGGAGVNSNRPQLSDAQAANYTAQKYLVGSDGWNPVS